MYLNLRNGQITVREVLNNPNARQVINQELPGILNHPMLGLAQGMSLNTVIGFARKRVPPWKINRLVGRLKEL